LVKIHRSFDEESLEAIKPVAEGKDCLAADGELTLELLEPISDNELTTRMAQVPWEKAAHPFGYLLSQMVSHLDVHMSQLFHYRRLMGKAVNTTHMWGSES
jgi:hypothetical protein